MSEGSVSQYLDLLKKGDALGLEGLWRRFFEQLTGIVKRRLSVRSRSVLDEEDVTLSVFRRLHSAVENGQLEQLDNRDDLWRVLVTITCNKVIDHQRHFRSKRLGGDRTFLDIRTAEFQQLDVLSYSSPPDFAIALEDEFSRLFQVLGDNKLRKIAALRLEGKSVQEIADITELSIRSVIRKSKLIHLKWSALLSEDEERAR